MDALHHGFWRLLDEFAPHAADGTRVVFVTSASVIATFLWTHPSWSDPPLQPGCVLALVLEASTRWPEFPWTVTEEDTDLRFTPR